MKHQDIDIVITWVDGNDPEWIESKNKAYKGFYGTDPASNSEVRFRDWDNLQYFFRGIEKYMPWVRKVHLVTCGHLPSWLNTDNVKLDVVFHKDYIPEQYLPTFNSNTIELNFHRIPDLAECFLLFNDDMFVINKTKPSDFFKNGVPRDSAAISPPPVFRDVLCSTENNNLQIINHYFSTQDIKRHIWKWVNPFLYKQYVLRTILFLPFSSILGVFVQHIPYSYNKSTFIELWDKEFSILDETCKNSFRSASDCNHWLFREWQILSNNFSPRRIDFGQLVSASDIDSIKSLVKSKKIKLICINDDSSVDNFDFYKSEVNHILEKLFPEKSSFEK